MEHSISQEALDWVLSSEGETAIGGGGEEG